MSYRFRKKMLFAGFAVFLFCSVCCLGESAGNENSTVPLQLGNNATFDHNNKKDNKTDNNPLKMAFYSVDSGSDEDEFDVPFLDGEMLKNLSLINGLQEVLGQLSNVDCVRDISYTLQATTRRERWALEMVDSSPKFPESILYGNFYQLGNFDECLEIDKEVKMESTNNEFLENTITGKYCLVDIQFKSNNDQPHKPKTENMALERNRASPDNSIIHWAICLPSTCSHDDASIIIKEMFSSSIANRELLSVNANPKNCETANILPVTTGEVVYGTLVGLFLLFTILATALHCWYLRQNKKASEYNVDTLNEKRPSMLKDIIVCFSLINTVGSFFHTKPNDLNLESIAGVKFLSMVTIVGGHSLIFFFGGPIANADFFLKVATRVENTIFLNGPIIVDTFLLLSGFLMCRLLLIEMDKRKGRINFMVIYIARYIRLTPAYAVVLGLYTTFLYRMGSGPFWEAKVGLEKERCQQSWWLNLLYVNNYVGTDNLCMFQSWYLAVDYHLFIVAPIVIYALWRKPKIGETILLLCTIVSVLLPFYITYENSLDPTVLGYPPEDKDLATNFYFVNYYIKTHMRCSSYCIGIFYAYLVHKIQKDSKKIPNYIVIVGWIVSIICCLASICSVVIFFEPTHVPNIVENALYAAFHRVGWALSIGWVLLVCITDNAAFINKFLSYKFFIPASRLTYCAYLANGLVEIYSASVIREPMYMSIFELACKTCGHIVLTFFLAFILCIIFESPIHGMEKILLKKFSVNHKTKKTDNGLENGTM